MRLHFMHPNATDTLAGLLYHVLQAPTVPSRNGTTKELLHPTITLTDPWPLEITTPGRRVSLPAQIAETMWLLAGRNDIEWLSTYLPRAKDFSDDGETWRGAYGPRIRGFRGMPKQMNLCEAPTGGKVDQLAHVIKLLTEDPDTRRAVLAIYDPAVDTEPGKDIPCNNWVHFLQRDGKLHAHVAIRSNDAMWGWSGINSFEWSALLHIVAGAVGMGVGQITFSISSLHLYEQHWAKAQRIADAGAGTAGAMAPFEIDNPRFDFSWVTLHEDTAASRVTVLDNLVQHWFKLEQAIRDYAAMTEPTGTDWQQLVARISYFQEPMMRSWLWVLLGWHTGTTGGVIEEKLGGTSLHRALELSPVKKQPQPAPAPAAPVEDEQRFVMFVDDLHRAKDEAYGDSWCRRGEQIGIMANIARKVDRLGVAGGGDTSADTAIDMLVYLLKYRLWLEADEQGLMRVMAPMTGAEHTTAVRGLLNELRAADVPDARSLDRLVGAAQARYTGLEATVTEGGGAAAKIRLVRALTPLVYVLARRLWVQEEAAKATKATPAERNATRSWNPEAGQQ